MSILDEGFRAPGGTSRNRPHGNLAMLRLAVLGMFLILGLLVFPTTVVLPVFVLLVLVGVVYSATRLLAPPPAPAVPTAV